MYECNWRQLKLKIYHSILQHDIVMPRFNYIKFLLYSLVFMISSSWEHFVQTPIVCIKKYLFIFICLIEYIERFESNTVFIAYVRKKIPVPIIIYRIICIVVLILSMFSLIFLYRCTWAGFFNMLLIWSFLHSNLYILIQYTSNLLIEHRFLFKNAIKSPLKNFNPVECYVGM